MSEGTQQNCQPDLDQEDQRKLVLVTLGGDIFRVVKLDTNYFVTASYGPDLNLPELEGKDVQGQVAWKTLSHADQELVKKSDGTLELTRPYNIWLNLYKLDTGATSKVLLDKTTEPIKCDNENRN